MSNRSRLLLGGIAGIVALAMAALIYGARTLEPRLHAWVTSTLSEALESEVDLGSVRLGWVPLQLHANNLTVRHHGRKDIPPLLVVSSFKVDLRVGDLWSSTIDRVWVDGLEVSVPPKDSATGKRSLPPRSPASNNPGAGTGLVVRHLTATNTRFAVIPREPGKNAKVWDVFELDLKNLRADQPATFKAALLNPIPYGKIEASGTFGPWQSAEPGRSAIAGDYTFNADLGTIEGLGGQLVAGGSMGGTIEQISTKGHTRTPDFRLTELDGISVPLQTDYEAIVDGTKGDVDLTAVDLTLGRSRFHAYGVVKGTSGISGKRVIVNVKSSSANLGE